VKAIAIANHEKGSVAKETFGLLQKNWKLLAAGSESNKGTMAFDANKETYWQAEFNDETPPMAIDLGAVHRLTAFIYTPPKAFFDGMIEKGVIQISKDGKNWEDAESFEFGNLINDPTARTHYFKNEISTRYIKLKPVTIAGNKKSVAIAELDFFEK
jgi:alpha-L-fucosidase